MQKIYTKSEAIKIVVECAKKYKEELEEKTLIFICINKHKNVSYFEFTFHAYNFMHLTGLIPAQSNTDNAEKSVSPIVFYKKCLNHKLSDTDFEFKEDGTSHLKLDALPTLICKNLNANIIGDYNGITPKLITDKLAGNTQKCMGFRLTEKSEYIPNTILKIDIRNYIKNNVRVIAVFRKKCISEQYDELTYKAKNIEWSKIKFPEEISYLYSSLI